MLLLVCLAFLVVVVIVTTLAPKSGGRVAETLRAPPCLRASCSTGRIVRVSVFLPSWSPSRLPRLGHDSCAAREAIVPLLRILHAGFGRLPLPFSIVSPVPEIRTHRELDITDVCACLDILGSQVQDGTYVSSMVEDASFLVHKSLRRSVSTRSEQAIMAVCNRVTEVSRCSRIRSSLIASPVSLAYTFPYMRVVSPSTLCLLSFSFLSGVSSLSPSGVGLPFAFCLLRCLASEDALTAASMLAGFHQSSPCASLAHGGAGAASSAAVDRDVGLAHRYYSYIRLR